MDMLNALDDLRARQERHQSVDTDALIAEISEQRRVDKNSQEIEQFKPTNPAVPLRQKITIQAPTQAKRKTAFDIGIIKKKS
jgi:hypothetical protein